MAGSSLQSKSKRRKIVVLTAWIQICTILSSLMTLLLVLATLYSPESSNRSYDTSRGRLPPGEEPGSASSSSGRKRKRNQTDLSTIFEAVNSMTADMKEACAMLSRSIHCDIVQERLLELPGALHSVDGLTKAEVRMAIQRFGKRPNEVLLFFGTDPKDRLEMVKDFLAND